jgi:hypothetical protein
MTARKGDWMITASGRRFYPLDPRPEDIDWGDVAHHLARLCRYGGAVDGWYSVAEHSVLMCDWFLARGDVEKARYGLIHDGPEYAINDIIKPIKPELPDFKRIEAPIERMMLAKVGLPEAMPPEIKTADTLIVGDERQQLFTMEALARAGWAVGETLGVTCRQWERGQARDEWMIRFRALFPGAAP